MYLKYAMSCPNVTREIKGLSIEYVFLFYDQIFSPGYRCATKGLIFSPGYGCAAEGRLHGEAIADFQLFEHDHSPRGFLAATNLEFTAAKPKLVRRLKTPLSM